jgi:hypothetical protein
MKGSQIPCVADRHFLRYLQKKFLASLIHTLKRPNEKTKLVPLFSPDWPCRLVVGRWSLEALVRLPLHRL